VQHRRLSSRKELCFSRGAVLAARFAVDHIAFSTLKKNVCPSSAKPDSYRRTALFRATNSSFIVPVFFDTVWQKR
jgi:hypothetical protein